MLSTDWSSSPRLAYVLDWIAQEVWDLPKGFWSDLPISYGYRDEQTWYIPRTTYLDQRDLALPSFETGQHGGLPCPFFLGFEHERAILPFDVFAACFFMLSRHEEYGSFEPDVHGRFPLKASWAYAHGVVDKAIIGAWLLSLAEALARCFSLPRPLVFKSNKPWLSYDIDHAFLHLGRGYWRGALAAGRSFWHGGWSAWSFRRAVLRSEKRDPYDLYDDLALAHRQWGLGAAFFWPLGDYALQDRFVSYKHVLLRQRMLAVGAWAELNGLHPSYRAADNPALLAKEANRFKEIYDYSPSHSRQHFLRFRFPSTPRALEDLGIAWDYSLGWAEAIGYRAGTLYPFHWYELGAERVHNLRFQPFVYMDATARYYQGLSPLVFEQKVEQVYQANQAFGGGWWGLWHNDILAQATWREAWQRLARLGL